MEVADLLTLRQLSELAATPSQLKTAQDVTNIMAVINPADFAAFFDTVSPVIQVKLHMHMFLFLRLKFVMPILY